MLARPDSKSKSVLNSKGQSRLPDSRHALLVLTLPPHASTFKQRPESQWKCCRQILQTSLHAEGKEEGEGEKEVMVTRGVAR